MTGNFSSLSARLKPWAVAVWLTVCLGLPSLAGDSAQRDGADTGTQRPKGTPSITATPERVQITAGSASTDIAWNTGNGSLGFVFVTANGRPPALVATGTEGSRIISWIRTGSYIFELYGDAERQTLLATVTVSGVAESATRPRIGLLHGQLRWLHTATLPRPQPRSRSVGCPRENSACGRPGRRAARSRGAR